MERGELEETAVLARDGLCCAHCRSRRNLHAHHAVWRSRGGPTTYDNLVTLCGVCHGLVHDGLLDVELVRGRDGELHRRFTNAHERLIGRWVLMAPRIEQEPAELPEVLLLVVCATAAVLNAAKTAAAITLFELFRIMCVSLFEKVLHPDTCRFCAA